MRTIMWNTKPPWYGLGGDWSVGLCSQGQGHKDPHDYNKTRWVQGREGSGIMR